MKNQIKQLFTKKMIHPTIFFIVGIISIIIVWVQLMFWIEQLKRSSEITFDYYVYKAVANFNNTTEHQKIKDIRTFDSLLNRSIKSTTIRSSCQYAIYNGKDSLLYISDSSFINELTESNYEFHYYSKGLFSGKNQVNGLKLYFPEKLNFYFARIGKITIWFLILGLFIVFSFVYSIVTIFKQNRLAIIKSDFINNMTHELKTPIATSSLVVDMLMDNSIDKGEDQLANYYRIIREENNRLKNIVEKMLQAARLEQGQLAITPRAVDMNLMLRNIAHNTSVMVAKRNGNIELDLKAKNHILEIDEVHFSNVIYTLIDNATKYTKDIPKIVLRTHDSIYGFELSIEDNGIGISNDDQKRIFDKFYRVHTGDIHNVKGFGMGLNYVKEIVERHEGKVTIQSELNRGSIFTIFLPYNRIILEK